MRGTVSEVTARTGFRPFNLTISVENETDLVALWARFNMSGEVLAPAAAGRAAASEKGPFSRSFVEKLGIDPEGKREVWKLLNAKLKETGISPR